MDGGSLQSEKEAVLKDQYENNLNVMKDLEKTFEEKIEESKNFEGLIFGEIFDMKKPHLIVLNEDQQLSYKLKYNLVDLSAYFGRKTGKPQLQIVLSGIGIKMNHVIFEIEEYNWNKEKRKNEENKYKIDEEKKDDVI